MALKNIKEYAFGGLAKIGSASEKYDFIRHLRAHQSS
jgi:hypothetical protein